MGDLSAPLPRVNGELLPRFVGRKVLLVGRVVSLDSGSMRVETCDKRQVTVTLKAGAGAYANSDYIEFEATVESPEAVRELEHSKFGTTFGACPAGGVALQTWAPPPKQGLAAFSFCARAERGAASTSPRHGQLQRAGQDGARQRAGAVLLGAGARGTGRKPIGAGQDTAHGGLSGDWVCYPLTSTHCPRLLSLPQPGRGPRRRDIALS
jgi:replication factor A3